jgi:hypothetical protein
MSTTSQDTCCRFRQIGWIGWGLVARSEDRFQHGPLAGHSDHDRIHIGAKRLILGPAEPPKRIFRQLVVELDDGNRFY